MHNPSERVFAVNYMRAFGMVVGVVVILLTACGGAPPRVSVEPPAQDLGEVPQQLLQVSYTVRNLGGSPLRIEKISTSCECTKATMDQDTIPPGGSAALRVTLDPIEDDLYGNLLRVIYIRSNDPATPEAQVELRVSILKATVPPTPPSLPVMASPATATLLPVPSIGSAAPDQRTPFALPTLTPAAAQNPTVYTLPKPIGAMQDRLTPPDVPACQGAQSLEKAIDFSWEQQDPSDWREVNTRTSEGYWTYYRCDQPAAAVLAFYRQAMSLPLYGWTEDHVDESSQGTLLVDKKRMDYTKHGYRWLYLWVFPDKSDTQASDLVTVWYDYSPC